MTRERRSHREMNTTADQQLVKRMNRSALLRLLRAQPGLSRAGLAAASGLTKSTVSLLVRELLDDGWLAETGIAVASGPAKPVPRCSPTGVHDFMPCDPA